MPRKTESEKAKVSKRPILQRINESLGVVFYLVWILIGLFFILFIVGNFRQGAFKGLFGSPPTGQQVQVPTETNLPGIGQVNVACLQETLSDEVIGKIIQEKGTSSLTDEEKIKLEPCIVEKEQTPSSPSQ